MPRRGAFLALGFVFTAALLSGCPAPKPEPDPTALVAPGEEPIVEPVPLPYHVPLRSPGFSVIGAKGSGNEALERLLVLRGVAEWLTVAFAEDPPPAFCIAVGQKDKECPHALVTAGAGLAVCAFVPSAIADAAGRPAFPASAVTDAVHGLHVAYLDAILSREPGRAQKERARLRDLTAAALDRRFATFSGAAESPAAAAGVRASDEVAVSGIVDLLVHYEQHRDRYPTFGGFLPKIAALLGEGERAAAAAEKAAAAEDQSRLEARGDTRAR